MPRKKKNIHYIYKTTNLLNGTYYIGKHSTYDINDDYLGSGKRLRYSIRKHGKENFIKEILEFCDDKETCAKREHEIVNKDLISDVMCMNLIEGGNGGFINIESCRKGGFMATAIVRERLKNEPDFLEKMQKIGAKNFHIAHKNKKIKYDTFTGKKHLEKTKLGIGIKNSINQIGEKNSQFGTCWITKNGKNKKIKKYDLDFWLKKNWTKGRKIKQRGYNE